MAINNFVFLSTTPPIVRAKGCGPTLNEERKFRITERDMFTMLKYRVLFIELKHGTCTRQPVFVATTSHL